MDIRRIGLSVLIVGSGIGLLTLSGVGRSDSSPRTDISDLYSAVDTATEDYLKANQTAEPNLATTRRILRAGSDLVLAVPPLVREGESVHNDEVRQHLSRIPLAIGCRELEPDDEDRLLRINIFLDQAHRPMCQNVQCVPARSAYDEPGGTSVVNETTTYCP